MGQAIITLTDMDNGLIQFTLDCHPLYTTEYKSHKMAGQVLAYLESIANHKEEIPAHVGSIPGTEL